MSNSSIEKRPKSKNLPDLLPYLGISESGTLWLRDGSPVRVLRVVPRSVLSMTDEEMQTLRSSLTAAISQCPERTLIQVLMVREQVSVTTDQAVQNWRRAHEAPSSSTTLASVQLYRAKEEVLRQFADAKSLLQSRIYLSVRVPPELKAPVGGKIGPLSHLAFCYASKKNRPRSREALEKDVFDTSATLKLGLETAGFEVVIPERQELLATISRALNPTRAVEASALGEPQLQFQLSEALCQTDLIEDRMGLRLGREKIRIGTLQHLPESSAPAVFTGLATSQQPFALVATLLVLPQIPERERLHRKQRLAQGMASGNQVRNLAAESQLQDIEDTLSAMIVSGEKLLGASFHLILASPDDGPEKDQRFEALLEDAQKCGAGCRWFEETVGSYPVFFGNLPFAPTFITRPKRILSGVLSDFLPLYGIGPGHEDARVLFETPFQSVLGFSLNERSSSGNAIIIGSTGAGKSVLACGLLLGMAAGKGGVS